MAPISFLFKRKPECGLQKFIGYREGSVVEGEVIYSRGLRVNQENILEGRADYIYGPENSSHSSSDSGKILKKIESGEIQTSKISWDFKWEIFVLGYFQLTLFVIFLNWIFKWESKNEAEKISH